MSEIGCYDLHLYCDFPECNEGEGGLYHHGPRFQQFTGRTLGECRKRARELGWVISPTLEGTLHGGALAKCPKHRNWRPKTESDDA